MCTPIFFGYRTLRSQQEFLHLHYRAMNQDSSISHDLETLFKKTTEANKIFFSESAKFIKNISASNLKGEEIFNTQQKIFKEAFNAFVKLNIQHTSNLLDLGVAITKRMNGTRIGENQDESGGESPTDASPSFVLNISAAAGTTATTQFLLDSEKKDPVFCHLAQSEFILEEDPSTRESFVTRFLPQSFQLNFGEAQKIEVFIDISSLAKEGIYRSDIKVEGFEHTYFTLVLRVTPPPEIPDTPPKAPKTTKRRKQKSK